MTVDFKNRYAGTHYFHLWLIPSIEFDYEDFSSIHYGRFAWSHLTISWLLWTVDFEWIREGKD